MTKLMFFASLVWLFLFGVAIAVEPLTVQITDVVSVDIFQNFPIGNGPDGIPGNEDDIFEARKVDATVTITWEIKNPGGQVVKAGTYDILQSSLDVQTPEDVRGLLGNFADMHRMDQQAGPRGMNPNRLRNLKTTR